jgi:hypothetical protein
MQPLHLRSRLRVRQGQDLQLRHRLYLRSELQLREVKVKGGGTN